MKVREFEHSDLLMVIGSLFIFSINLLIRHF